MAKLCSNCNHEFLEGERRFTYTNKLHNRNFSALDALKGYLLFGQSNIQLSSTTETGEIRHFCVDCANNLGKSYAYFQKFTNKITDGSYIQSQLIKPPDQSPVKRRVPVRIKTPVKKKIKKFVASKKQFLIFRNSVKSLLQQEMTKLVKYSSFNQDQINRDNWLPSDNKIKSELILYAPLVYKVLQGLTCRSPKNLFNNHMRSIYGVALHSRNRFVNLFQKSIGLSLFIGKASTQTYNNLSKLGLTVSYKTVLKTLDSLGMEYDQDLVAFKKDKTNQLEKYTRELENDTEEDDSNQTEPSGSGGPRRRLQFDKEKEHFYSGGMFTTDNINHVVLPIRISSKNQPKALNMTSNAFIFNRIPLGIEKVFQPNGVMRAVDVPLNAYLPTLTDINLIRNDHLVIIKRILVRFIKPFQSLNKHPSVNWYIDHKYSLPSAKKSKVISLGILDVNQTTTEGTKHILKYLSDFFPTVDGKVFKQVVAGDVLSVKMIVNAKHHLSNSDPTDNKLEGPVPAVGQFHLRMHLLKDMCKLFFNKGTGCPGRGTAPFLMTFFKHPEKLKDPQHNFLLTVRFFKFCLVAHIVALAKDLLELHIEGNSEKLNETSEDEKVSQLSDLAERVLEFEWHDIYKITAQEKFCFCQTEYDSSKVYIACSNDFCRHRLWYHVDCLRIQPQGSNQFNFPPSNARLKRDSYYCTEQCAASSKDKKLMYSKALINATLNFEGYRDSIRTNDGLRMDAYNKLHLIEFNNYKHPVYFKYCHLWQTRKHGWTSPSAQFDLLHNSTVNITGGRSSNLESDLFHEMLNRYLKDILLIPHGGMTPGSIKRRSRAFQVLKELRNEYTKLLNEYEDSDDDVYHSQAEKWSADLESAAKVILEEKLTTDCGDRVHPGFKNFRYDLFYIDNISAYKERIVQASRIEDDVDVYSKEKRM